MIPVSFVDSSSSIREGIINREKKNLKFLRSFHFLEWFIESEERSRKGKREVETAVGMLIAGQQQRASYRRGGIESPRYWSLFKITEDENTSFR